MIALETARLRIRPLTPADAAFVLAVLTDPDFVANIGNRGVHDMASAEAYLLTGPLRMYADHGFGLCVVEVKGGAAVGLCGVLRRDGLEHPDLGYALLPGARGQGYAREAAAGVLGWAVARGIDPLLAVVSRGNAPSIGVLESLGFTADGEVRLVAGAEPVLRYVHTAHSTV